MKFEQLRKDMVAAMKAKDKERKEGISVLIGAIKKVAIDAGNREQIPDEMVDAVILKELKSAKEQIDTCPKERTDRLAEYEKRYQIIKQYAPQQLSEQEIHDFIIDQFPELVAAKNKGMIMKSVMAELKGKADGKLINKIVGQLCE